MNPRLSLAFSAALLGILAQPVAAASPDWGMQAGVQRRVQSDINGMQRQIARMRERPGGGGKVAALRRDIAALQRQYNDFMRGGLTRAEGATLERGVASIRARLP